MRLMMEVVQARAQDVIVRFHFRGPKTHFREFMGFVEIDYKGDGILSVLFETRNPVKQRL